MAGLTTYFSLMMESRETHQRRSYPLNLWINREVLNTEINTDNIHTITKVNKKGVTYNTR